MLRIPIDGAYHSDGLVATAVEAGQDIGSDHLPLLVRLRLRQR
jgi:endonuclease/exonuclease/phosphatase (EEP) superfamily protein YafD